MNNLIKPFYIYSCYYTNNESLNKHSSQIISYNLEDLDDIIFTLPDSCFEISCKIRFDYNLQLFAYQTIYTVDSVNVIKLNFEQFNLFYNQQQNNNSLFKLLGTSCYKEVDNLLDLILVNWDEWN